MTDNAINLMRRIVASRWRYLCLCWLWRPLITELLDAYEKAECKAHAAKADLLHAVMETETLRVDLAAAEAKLKRLSGGNEVLLRFIRDRHNPTVDLSDPPLKIVRPTI